jgi:anti-anti-sigma factor
MNAAFARYAQQDHNWFLKLGGDLRHPVAPALNRLLDRALADPDTANFVIDLAEADNIDSTCLGVLARIGNHQSCGGGSRPVIICPEEDIREMLRAVCFDYLFDLVEQPMLGDDPLQPLPLPPDEDDLRKLILDAHRRLCEIDERTRLAFRDVIQALEQDPSA